MSEPPTPAPAATVIVLRDTASGPEVFLMKRNIKSNAFAGMYVFPGGRVDDDDQAAELYARSDMSDAEASAQLGVEKNGLSYYIAAVRECFEETGVFLATNAKDFDPDELRDLRDKLNGRSISFSQICQQLSAQLAVKNIAYCAHWITPREEKRRFDTRFFVTSVPEDQALHHDGAELVESLWLSPAAALKAGEDHEIMLIAPTIANLKTVSNGETALEVVDYVRNIDYKPAIMPKIRTGSYADNPRKMEIVMPWDKGYDEL